MASELRDIPLDEWEAHEWIDASSWSQSYLFIRKDNPPPPNDGFKYVWTGSGWTRARTISPPAQAGTRP